MTHDDWRGEALGCLIILTIWGCIGYLAFKFIKFLIMV